MADMNRYDFDELTVGLAEVFSVSVTDDMMNKFCSITGDINPLHTDKDFAVSHGFESCVTYGFLTASFLSTLAGVYIPGERSIIQEVSLKFAKPVYVGDELKVSGTIAELHRSVKQMVMKVEIRNQNDAKVLRGTMKVGVQD